MIGQGGGPHPQALGPPGGHQFPAQGDGPQGPQQGIYGEWNQFHSVINVKHKIATVCARFKIFTGGILLASYLNPSHHTFSETVMKALIESAFKSVNPTLIISFLCRSSVFYPSLGCSAPASAFQYSNRQPASTPARCT